MIRPFPSELSVTAKAGSGPRRSARMLLAGLLIAGLGTAGCGGSSSTTKSTAAPAITKTAFVAKANEICSRADPVLSQATAQLATRPPAAQVARVVKSTFVPLIETQITGIRALGVPSGDQVTIANMLNLVQADVV